MKKKHPVIRNLLADIMAAGLALVVFALFHHVLPRRQQSLNIQTVRPAAATVSTAGPAEEAAAETVLETAVDAETAATPVAAERTEAAEAEESGDGPVFRSGSRSVASAGISDTKPRGGSGRSKGKSGTDNGGSGSRNGTDAGSGTNSRKKTGGKSGMNSKGGSALTEADESAAEAPETNAASVSEGFADRFTDTVTVTENSYSSPDVSIKVEEVNEEGLTYYVADVYVRDITCFRTALAENTYGSGYRDSITGMAEIHNALLAVNGDYYGNTGEGVVIRNGVIYRANPTNCDVCVLYYDGTMKVMPGSAFSAEEAAAEGAWQAWTFGPALLDGNGEAITAFSSSARIIAANPRTAIGYYEPGHYCLVVVDGRGTSAGMTLGELSRLFEKMGCTAAYNLDGGNSSVMVWGDEVINRPSGGGRESSDALLIAEVRTYE